MALQVVQPDRAQNTLWVNGGVRHQDFKKQRAMLSIGKQFGLAFLGALPFASLLQWYLEYSGNSDALGLWYTICCAVLYSILLAAMIVAAVALKRRTKN
jgi:hypothetical protein